MLMMLYRARSTYWEYLYSLKDCVNYGMNLELRCLLFWLELFKFYFSGANLKLLPGLIVWQSSHQPN